LFVRLSTLLMSSKQENRNWLRGLMPSIEDTIRPARQRLA